MSPEQPEIQKPLQKSEEEIDAEQAAQGPPHILDRSGGAAGDKYGFANEQERATGVEEINLVNEIRELQESVADLIEEIQRTDDQAVQQELDNKRRLLLAAQADLYDLKKARGDYKS